MMCSAHFRDMVEATDVPLNADFENGFADDPDGVAVNVTRCIVTGVAGLSIEDATGKAGPPLYELELAVARIEAARAAIDRAGGDVVLTGRAEGFIRGVPDLDDVIRRLTAYKQRPAPIASMRPASKPANRSKRWSKRWRRSRSISSTAARSALR